MLQIPRWLHDHHNKHQQQRSSRSDAIAYHYHLMRAFNEQDNMPFPAVIYIVAGRPHLYDGPLDEEGSFTRWLSNVTDWTIGGGVLESGDWRDLDAVLNESSTCPSSPLSPSPRKWLLMIHDHEHCPISNWRNLLRSVKNQRHLRVLHMPQPISAESQARCTHPIQL